MSWCPDDEPDDVSQAYALADNRTAELSAWDFEELSAQLRALAEADPQAPAALGWDEGAAALLLAARWEPPAVEPLPTQVAEPPVTVVLSAEQNRVVQLAVARVRASEGDRRMTVGRCLELVCADFLGGPDAG